MPQEVNPPSRRQRALISPGALRVIGLALLVILIARLDLNRVCQVFADADPRLMVLSITAVVPLILVKTIRWQGILRAQAIRFALWPALLAYFSSLFIGFLTPGRLGEFSRALHIQRDQDIPFAQAVSSVLADRLFDLYALLSVGSAALLTLALGTGEILVVILLIVLLTLPLILFLHGAAFAWIQRIGSKLGTVGRKLFAPDGILPGIRAGLRQLTWQWMLFSIALTVLAYGIFFGQCYLLALGLDLPVGFVPVMFAVALGSLVTLIPISISGLGTREAAMIAYLSSAGIDAESAISFSLLVFVTFYIAGGLIGAAAWWIKPVPIHRTDLSL
jgi:uncharacterized protein (TIRG00374 family)